MPTVSRTFTVSPSVDVVVDYLKDFAHTEHWDPGTVTCTRVGDGPIAVGARWRNVSEFRGKTAELDYALVRLDPDHLVFEGNNSQVRSTDDMSFTAAPDGGTTVSYTARLDFKGVLALAGPFLKKTFEGMADATEKQMRQVLDQLA